MLPREVFEGMLTETGERVNKKIEAVGKLIKHLKECHGSEDIGKAEHYPKNPFNYTERFCFFVKKNAPTSLLPSIFFFTYGGTTQKKLNITKIIKMPEESSSVLFVLLFVFDI